MVLLTSTTGEHHENPCICLVDLRRHAVCHVCPGRQQRADPTAHILTPANDDPNRTTQPFDAWGWPSDRHWTSERAVQSGSGHVSGSAPAERSSRRSPPPCRAGADDRHRSSSRHADADRWGRPSTRHADPAEACVDCRSANGARPPALTRSACWGFMKKARQLAGPRSWRFGSVKNAPRSKSSAVVGKNFQRSTAYPRNPGHGAKKCGSGAKLCAPICTRR